MPIYPRKRREVMHEHDVLAASIPGFQGNTNFQVEKWWKTMPLTKYCFMKMG
jgi:hypothetical protein